ncbi:MAG: DNA polymerase IV [Bosea sp.]|jgi:DNA polymerase-4|nr:DNA polymerase IV [Bosea sp. (in: a-proteobacteria)]
MLQLCRDCLADAESRLGNRRCAACGSPRLISHPERDALAIAHVDCDAFYASIEKRDDPALADKPVIVGGGRRGVVATCCYVARTYGVRSAMPMFKALEACPNAVVIKPDMAKYARVGRDVRTLMLELTPLVEPISIDEAFLDLTGTERLHRASPAVTLARFARRVEGEIGITISVGLSYAKFLAKIASDMDKPRGFSILGEAEAVEFLAGKPVTILPGVGRAAADRLAEAGFRQVGDLAAAPPERLFALLGKEGPRLQRLSRGIDERKVSPDHETRSVSSETTFDMDIADHAELEPILWRMAEKTARRLRKAELAGRTVTLKLKTADFRLLTRSRQLNEPTQLAKRLYDSALALLRAEPAGARYRLLGVGVADLSAGSDADQGDLADAETPRVAAVERAMEKLRDRFGAEAVVKGVGLGRAPATSRKR